ncbi:MAG: sodium:calcium antiporter, partial [Myxococcales bacterium]
AYMYAVARGEVEEPHLEGSAELIASLSRPMRRAVTFGLFVVAGFTIFIASEPFAEALLDIGQEFGVDQFLLVQWLAPLASESPEFIVAILFSLRLKPTIAFSALLSSKVNQWTLLIGMLPLAYSASRGGLLGMVLEERQAREILLTSAQSLFAIVILADMRFGIREALALLVLFSIQLAWPEPIVRDAFIWIYCGLSLVMLVVRPQTRASLYRLVRTNPFR